MWLGIDFGTSNSSATRLVNGHPHAVREPSMHQPFFPSCVLLLPPNGTASLDERLTTGIGAERRSRVYPDRFRAELKRNLGEEWPLLLGGEPVPVLDAVAAVIRALKTEADRMTDGPFTSAMMTVPVAFGADRVAMVEAAARAAGFEHVTHCLEPEAAARYHAYAAKSAATDELFLVYDFGGGTFDASLVRSAGGAYAIVASSGIEDCGGRDLDQELFGALVRRASPALRDKLIAPIPDGMDGTHDDADINASLRLRLNALDRCRRVKHDLSTAEWSEIDLGDPPELVRFDRAEFETMIAPHIARTLDCCDTLVRAEGLEWTDVSRVLLVGGTTRIPAVAKALHDRFGRPAASVEDPELAVSFGASLASARRAEDPDNATETAAEIAIENASNERETTISLQALIDAAEPHSEIVVAPGIYREALHVGKPIALVAESGESGERPVIESADKPALVCASEGVVVRGLGFHSQNAEAAIRLEKGSLEISGCDVWGGKTGAICATKEGKLAVRGTRAHDSFRSGIYLAGNVVAIVEDTECTANGSSGICVNVAGGTVELRGNRLSRNVAGIRIMEGGSHVAVVANDSFENQTGIECDGSRAFPVIRDNRCHDNKASGLMSLRGAGGTIERNTFEANATAALTIRDLGTSPLVRDNTIAGGSFGLVIESAGGIVLENRISGTTAIHVSGNAVTNVRDNSISGATCILASESGGATFEGNRFVASGAGALGVNVRPSSTVRLRRNSFEGPFRAFFSVMPGARDKAFTYVGNRLGLDAFATPATGTLARLLERGEWAQADKESIGLIRAASGSVILKTKEEAAAIPPELLKTVDRLWLLACDEPLRYRTWVKLPLDGVTQMGWSGQTHLFRRLRELEL